MALSKDEMRRIFASFKNDQVSDTGDVVIMRPAFDLRFRLTPFDLISVNTEADYLVRGIIPRHGLAVIWGPPKCGKSFWTFDLVMHIALGWDYRGHHVQQGSVVYLALEGGRGFSKRVEAWRRRHGSSSDDAVPFFLLDVPVDLIADRDKLITAIKAQFAEPAVIVIDTLNRALNGSENKPEDMARFIRAADVMRTAFDCAVIIIHHCGIAGDRPRGHSSLAGADDAQIAIERSDAGIINVAVEHLKDGEASPPMACFLERVELGTDSEGEPVSSCVVVPIDGAAATGAPKASKLSPTVKLALDQLRELIGSDASESAPASNHIPSGARVCPAALWREAFYKGLIDERPDTKKKAFSRAAGRLQELKIIGVWADKVWLRDLIS